MAPRAATIYDVAKRAGVSPSTVSLALNDPRRVRTATLDRILLAADQLAFVPKAEAVSRARRALGRIGVLAPFTSYPVFARRLYGVMQALEDRALDLVVFDRPSAVFSAPTLSSIPLTHRLDGLIIMSLPIDRGVAERILERGLPTVLVDVPADLRPPQLSSVDIDDETGGRLAAEHLLARGHERFGAIQELFEQGNGGGPNALPPDRRLAAFRTTLERAGLRLPPTHVRDVPHTPLAARDAVRELLALPDRPTAIFARDDSMAAAAVRAARDLDLKVPQDVAVIGFDDGELAEHLGLTTIRQPMEESGQIATRVLLDHLDGSQATVRHTTLPVELVERDTT